MTPTQFSLNATTLKTNFQNFYQKFCNDHNFHRSWCHRDFKTVVQSTEAEFSKNFFPLLREVQLNGFIENHFQDDENDFDIAATDFLATPKKIFEDFIRALDALALKYTPLTPLNNAKVSLFGRPDFEFLHGDTASRKNYVSAMTQLAHAAGGGFACGASRTASQFAWCFKKLQDIQSGKPQTNDLHRPGTPVDSSLEPPIHPMSLDLPCP